MDESPVARLGSLARIGDDGLEVFEAPPSGGSDRMYGGEVAALALAAAQRTVAADRAVQVAHAAYLRPGDPEVPLLLEVQRLTDGRRFSGRRVDVRQRHKLIFTSTLSFHRGGQALSHQDPMPDVPGPEGLPRFGSQVAGPVFWPDWAVPDPVIDLRPVPGDLDDPTGTRAIWYRIVDEVPADPATQACLWLYASDLTLVASIRLAHERTAGKTWLMTSLNHTVWFHRPFRADEWHLVVQRSPLAGQGRGLATGQVFSRNGVLVSSIAQEGLASPIHTV
jgi:acyl-CoA thioesterase-2